jgi:mannose-6-phosphate isomerase-like protein (cupin superfamily)
MKIRSTNSRKTVYANIGNLAELTKAGVPTKHFLRGVLGLTSMEASITAYPPNHAFHSFHSHDQNEELYIIVSGEGAMQIDNEIIPVREGSVVRILPGAIRNIRSGLGSELVYVCVQAKMDSLEQSGMDDVRLEKRDFSTPNK